MTEDFKVEARCRHVLTPAAFDAIRFREVVIVIEEKRIKKKKKEKVTYTIGHRYFLLTDHHVYVIPIKGKEAAGTVQPQCWLEDIASIEIMNDGADFLVPELEENAVHIKVEYRDHFQPRAATKMFDLYTFIKGSTLPFFIQQSWRDTKLRYNYDDPSRLRTLLAEEVEPSEWGSSDDDLESVSSGDGDEPHGAPPTVEALRLDLSKVLFFQGTSTTHDPHGSPRDPMSLSARLRAARTKSPRTPRGSRPPIADRIEGEGEQTHSRAGSLGWISGVGRVSTIAQLVVSRRRRRLARAGDSNRSASPAGRRGPPSMYSIPDERGSLRPEMRGDEDDVAGFVDDMMQSMHRATPRDQVRGQVTFRETPQLLETPEQESHPPPLERQLSRSAADMMRRLRGVDSPAPSTARSIAESVSVTLNQTSSTEEVLRIARAHVGAEQERKTQLDAARVAMTSRSTRRGALRGMVVGGDSSTTRSTSIPNPVSIFDTMAPHSEEESPPTPLPAALARIADGDSTTRSQTSSPPGTPTARTFESRRWPDEEEEEDDEDLGIHGDGRSVMTHTSMIQSVQAVFLDMAADFTKTANLRRRTMLLEKLAEPLLRHRVLKKSFFESEGLFRVMVADMKTLSEDDEKMEKETAEREREEKVKEDTRRCLDGVDFRSASIGTAQQLATIHTPLRQPVGDVLAAERRGKGEEEKEAEETPASSVYPSPWEFSGSGRHDVGAALGPAMDSVTDSMSDGAPGSPLLAASEAPPDQTMGLGGRATFRRAIASLHDEPKPDRSEGTLRRRAQTRLRETMKGARRAARQRDSSPRPKKPKPQHGGLRVVRLRKATTHTERITYAVAILDVIHRALRNSVAVKDRLNIVWQPEVSSHAKQRQRPTLVGLMTDAAKVAIKYGDFARRQPVWVDDKGRVKRDVDPYEDYMDRHWRRKSRELHLLLGCMLYELKDLLDEANAFWNPSMPRPPSFISLMRGLTETEGFEALTYGIVENCVSITWRPFQLDFVALLFQLLQILLWLCEADKDAWDTVMLEHEHAFRYLLSNPEQQESLVETLPLAQDTLMLLREILGMFGPITAAAGEIGEQEEDE